jgi:hypothetical protein
MRVIFNIYNEKGDAIGYDVDLPCVPRIGDEVDCSEEIEGFEIEAEYPRVFDVTWHITEHHDVPYASVFAK